MDRFLKRKAAPSAGGGGSSSEQFGAKRPREEGGVALEGDQSGVAGAVGDPRKLISWNVNGLVPQLRNGWSEIRDFLERERPDLLCLQEVRLPAAGPGGCKRGDGQRRRRGEAKRDSQQEKDDWDLIEKTLLAFVKQDYVVHWSFADWKYAGTALLVRRPLRPARVSFTLPSLVAGGHPGHRDAADPSWHPDGRIIYAEFSTFDVLATYAPNNGNDVAAFARRAAWDKALLTDLGARKRPLIWMGDLNCAAEAVDVTHPEWFLQQCYQGDPPDMRGQPGFTPGERCRFRELLEATRLVDVYRRLHPASEPPLADGPHYTWRGHPPVHQYVAKYHGKGMRIDYALVAEELLPRAEEASILGRGADRIGFMGSDHCPICLVLRKAEQPVQGGLERAAEAAESLEAKKEARASEGPQGDRGKGFDLPRTEAAVVIDLG